MSNVVTNNVVVDLEVSTTVSAVVLNVVVVDLEVLTKLFVVFEVLNVVLKEVDVDLLVPVTKVEVARVPVRYAVINSVNLTCCILKLVSMAFLAFCFLITTLDP